jgi:hypothetical protein
VTASGGEVVVVVAAVIERDGRILITRRPKGAHLEAASPSPARPRARP